MACAWTPAPVPGLTIGDAPGPDGPMIGDLPAAAMLGCGGGAPPGEGGCAIDTSDMQKC